MMSELLDSMLRFNLALAVACIVMLALRGPLLSQFGARIAYRAWLVVPLAGLATLAPPREIVTTEMTGVSQTPPPIGTAILESPGLMGQTLAPPATVLAIVWLLGVLATVAALFWQHRRFITALGGLTADVIGGAAVLRASTCDCAPLTLGALRPRIVVPADFEERFTPREQALIIAHEQWHIRSGDLVINAVLELAVCAFWFNLVFRGATRFLREDQELACDAAVLERTPAARRTYAEALLNTQTVVDVVPIGCGWPSTHRVLARRLAALGNKPPGRSVETLGLVVVFSLACSISWTAWASEERKVAASQEVAPNVDRTQMQKTGGLERGTLALETARMEAQRRLSASRSAPLQRTNDMLHNEHVVRDALDQEQTSRFAEAFNNADDRSNDARRDAAGNAERSSDVARNSDRRSDEANR